MGCTSSKYQVYPITFNKESVLDFDNKECIICLNTFDENATNKVILECGHSFHYECILSWFDKKMTCPYCQKKFVWQRATKKITKKYKN